MRCRYCDSALPERALFCGECGRPVTASQGEPSRPIVARPLTVPAPPPEPGLTVLTGSIRTIVDACEQCGSALAPTDIFCGECGAVSRPRAPAESEGDFSPAELPIETPDAESAGRVAAQPRIETPPSDSAGRVAAEPRIGTPPSDSAGRVAAQPRIGTPPSDSAGRVAAQPRIGTQPSDSAGRVAAQPRIETPLAERFILQFSTGDSVTVTGSGLIGRNPRPEPGEFFDELVRVHDSTRSVSKTHLEFGQEGGEFWVKDRFSGNGTVLRGPDAPVVQLVADRRYRVPRGSRVDVGEQFFVVS